MEKTIQATFELKIDVVDEMLEYTNMSDNEFIEDSLKQYGKLVSWKDTTEGKNGTE
jgi:hypothetical protein